MRHHSNTRKFGREKNQRKALLSSLARNLIKDGKIKTTLPKAKELRPMIEKMITKAKKATVASQRLIQSRLRGASEAKKLFKEMAPKYASKGGGYTRITKLPRRDLDGSPMAVIEFV